MNKQEIINKIAEDYGVSKVVAKQIFEQIFDDITETIISFNTGNKIQIPGFGSFETKRKAETERRNPKTGEKILVPAKYTVKFKAAKALKDKIN